MTVSWEAMSIFKLLVRKSASIVRMSSARRWLMAEAALWLALAGVALLVLRFRTIASYLGQSLTPAEAVARMAEAPNAGDARELVRDIG